MMFWWVSACLSTIMVFFVTRCTFTDLIWGTEAHCWNLKCPQVFDKMWFEWQRSFIHAAQLWSRKWSGRQQNTSAWIRHTFCFHFLILHPLSSFLQKAKIQEISERNVNVFINDRNQFRHLSRETEGIKMDYNRSASSDEARALRFVTSPSAASSVWFGAKSRAEVSSLHSFSLHILKVTEENLSFLHRLQEFGSICLKFFCQLNPPQKWSCSERRRLLATWLHMSNDWVQGFYPQQCREERRCQQSESARVNQQPVTPEYLNISCHVYVETENQSLRLRRPDVITLVCWLLWFMTR